ncbi:MAG TPA: hypothetical protein VLI72_05485 [Methylibium sp.]|nr:hypothetical protein [Methylibium sp.]
MGSVLHCAAALLKAMRVAPAALPSPERASNALGAWSVTLIHARPQKLALAVCHASRHGFVFPAAPLATLPERFGPALFGLLVMLGAPVDAARREVDAMQPLALAPTADRGVRAHMGQYADDVRWRLAGGAGLAECNLFLAGNLVLRPAVFHVGEQTFTLLGLDPAPVRRLTRVRVGLSPD